ncbi:MAG: hypothetical protein A2V21_302860 [Deltaproteobacteria bacterium GWC2_55_46]|nr:MAG: hypothetical protein A2Z79_05800 [Deltaproteobacteria bacterium GWA2_55_82]OGQ62385.1 MAG: hypothetical protein A3I81_01245 [Deltaproteobacteria bacterium RIFCSPLOWO2_02_FULL_55_12]OIJ73297.1 MAG: hypothetical protein A2V21_302860 [Deltaproteobacteria bacterium GWC2_55_46]
MSGRSKGFSLVELIIVIALATILMAIAAPSIISQLSHLRLTRTVRDVATELNAARLKAIAQNTSFRVDFSGGTYNLWIYSGGAWVDYPTRGQGELGAGIDITSPGDTFSVQFYTNGAATATTICVNNTQKSDDRMQINVTGTTGMITVSQGC